LLVNYYLNYFYRKEEGSSKVYNYNLLTSVFIIL